MGRQLVKELHDLARTELPRRPGRKGLQKGQGDILSQAILSCRIPSTKRGVNSLRCSPGRWECKYLDRRIFTPLYRSLLTQGQDGRVPACLGVPSSRIRVTQAASVARLPRDVGGEPHSGLSQGTFSCRSRVLPTSPIRLITSDLVLARHDPSNFNFPLFNSSTLQPTFPLPSPRMMEAIYGIPEISIIVFQCCNSFRDVVALASTCKTLEAVWRRHPLSIIWPVAQTEMPGFSQALIAVSPSARATLDILTARWMLILRDSTALG